MGWLYTYGKTIVYTTKNLHWCKRWKTEKGAKENFDSYNQKWQVKSEGGYLKIEQMPEEKEAPCQSQEKQDEKDKQMNEPLEPLEELDELTLEFLKSVNYPRVHMIWSEWFEEAKAYELSDKEITELEQYLEKNNQLTSPVAFGGRQWWLTKREIQHLELLKQYYPATWEIEADNRMRRLSLGELDKDWQLKAKMSKSQNI